ncbi:MAG: SHOCT domain-containing protein [Acidimicrobiia bacterium]|jgi:hypothetical protein|nr:SHOCT domain-containing protein [Acidimicrobiia bacterium]
MARTAVVAGTATAVSGRVSRRQQGRYAEQDQAAPAPAPEEAPAGDATDDKVAHLKELADLKDQGILSEEEFAAEKAKILAS